MQSMEFSRPEYWEWVDVSFSRGSSQPRDRTQLSCNAGGFFTSWTTREALRGWDGWVASQTDFMDMTLSRLRELVMDREAWRAEVHGVSKIWIRLSGWTELRVQIAVLGCFMSFYFGISTSLLLFFFWHLFLDHFTSLKATYSVFNL